MHFEMLAEPYLRSWHTIREGARFDDILRTSFRCLQAHQPEPVCNRFAPVRRGGFRKSLKDGVLVVQEVREPCPDRDGSPELGHLK
jgi:hypothetical protein